MDYSDLPRWLDRTAAAAFLTARGFPCAAATLSTKACRGGGPPFAKYGTRCLYAPADLLDWAEAKISPPRRSTSEGEAGRG
jgi:hypothetical protein